MDQQNNMIYGAMIVDAETETIAEISEVTEQAASEAVEAAETTSIFINSDGTVEFSPSENMDTEIVINKDGSFEIITSDVETTEETTEVPEEAEGIKLFFKPEKFVENLDIMGKGMLGIFIVIGIIIASVYALGMIGKKKNNKQQ